MLLLLQSYQLEQPELWPLTVSDLEKFQTLFFPFVLCHSEEQGRCPHVVQRVLMDAQASMPEGIIQQHHRLIIEERGLNEACD